MNKSTVEQVKTLQQKVPGNLECADCGKTGKHIVKFCSVKLGVFLCNQCYAAHRALGAHITRAKCIGLDSFTTSEVELLTRLGNSRVNAAYEANMPSSAKPPPTDCNGCSSRSCQDCTHRLRFIGNKYEKKLWYSELLTPVAATSPTSTSNKEISQRTISTGPKSSFDPFGLSVSEPARALSPSLGQKISSCGTSSLDNDDPFGFFNTPSTTSTSNRQQPSFLRTKSNKNDDFFASFGL